MGLSQAAIKLNLTLWKRGLYENIHSVVDMGAQGLHLKFADFDYLLKSAGIGNYPKEKFESLKYFPSSPIISAKEFYRLLGIDQYNCIDLVSSSYAIRMDLNYPCKDRSMYGKYDLLTDYGNNEHPFNMPEAYRTMHRLCKNGGLMIIQQGVLWGNGYFNFDESFFESLAAANNYQILFSSYVVTLKEMTPSGSLIQLHIPLSRALLNAFEYSKISHIEISYVFRKQSDTDFEYPYDAWTHSLATQVYTYDLNFLPDPPSRAYVPILKFYENPPMPIVKVKSLRVFLRRIAERIIRAI